MVDPGAPRITVWRPKKKLLLDPTCQAPRASLLTWEAGSKAVEGRACEGLGGSGRVWEGLGGSGRAWEWEGTQGPGREPGKGFQGFGGHMYCAPLLLFFSYIYIWYPPMYPRLS